jgi:hypothetical protein
MLSGKGLCDELITRPEESYRLWCVVVCDLENLRNEEDMTRVGWKRHSLKKKIYVARIHEYQILRRCLFNKNIHVGVYRPFHTLTYPLNGQLELP